MVPANATEAPEPAPVLSKLDYFKLQLLWIELCVLLTACILLFLALFGSFRRRCRNGLFKIMLWACYLSSTTLLIYTLGQMQSTAYSHRMFGIWAAFLFILLGSGVSISAYSLEDNEQWLRFLWNIVIKIIWLGFLINLYNNTIFRPKFALPFWFLFVVTLLNISERIRTFKLARRAGLARNTRLIAHFMEYEHELSKPNEGEGTPMNVYDYLVKGDDEKKAEVTPPNYHQRLEITDEVITIRKIWQCKGRLLTLESDNQLKDLCLSFALFRLICRRFAEFPLWECFLGQDSKDRTWNFVQYGLLSKNDDYERPFRVIEVELSFLFDRFYTKYPTIFQPRQLRRKIIELIFIIIGSCFAAKSLNNYERYNEGYAYGSLKLKEINFDILVTGIVIIIVISFQVVQIFLIMFSDWAKVSLICNYVKKPNWQESKCIEVMIKFICHGRWLKPWERKIGQYSLLTSSNRKCCRLIYNCLTSNFFDGPGEGRKGSTHIKLPAQVKKAIILSLKKINGPKLTNGAASLLQNKVKTEHISWVCKPESTIHVIMVWHIATSLCELALSKSTSRRQSEDFIIATSLSKYCAYLVAFAPRFLPNNAYLSEFLFDHIVKETGDFLKKCKSKEERYEKMMGLADDSSSRELTVIKRSALLGKYLIHEIKSEDLRWKILAEFWAEMMLFVAPSDDVTIHAEYLARGGELITHLWALLSHAGILKQDLAQEISTVAP